MEKKMLFPRVGGFVHGGDYNPEQWLDRPDILEEDVRLMKKAGMNSATVGVFSWFALEPREGEYHFEWLGDIIDRLYENGIYTVLATPSGARPAWLDAACPEAMRVDRRGMRAHHGGRHNHCMSSPVYREKVAAIDRKLAERFGSHPGVIMYHISNEFSGECFCPCCVEKFRNYLAEKYDHDIDRLNAAWWTAFWSHSYNDFQQIEPPFENGETSVMGLNLEWKRFTTWNTNDFMEAEIRALRSVTPDVPVTANFMRLFGGLDYRKMAPALDAVSWDNYPTFHNDWETLGETMAETAFQHAVMRSLKRGTPFMMMESAPGLVNWQAFNKIKRPGIHRLACVQAVACGSDTVQYFQWRKGRGSYEQFHGAVVDHLGTDDTRIFREVAEVGELLKKIAPAAGTLVKPRAALLLDWDNRWAIDDAKAFAQSTKKYEETCIDIWKAFFRLGVEMDVVGSHENLDDYDVVAAPMLYMLQPGTAANLKAFVERGGQLFATYCTGYVNEEQLCFLGGFPGDGLKELFGIVSEEIDTLYPSDRNGILLEDGSIWEVRDYAEILRVRDARILGTYTDDFYRGGAALTCRTQGRGKAYYAAARTDAAQMEPLFERMLVDAGIPVRRLPEGVECHERTGETGRFFFYLNNTTETVTVSGVEGRDLVTDREVKGELVLPGYGVAVVQAQSVYSVPCPGDRACRRTAPVTLEVPGSKSITNRALLLAALAEGTSCLEGVLFSDDSRHFLKCLQDLGFETEVNEADRRVSVHGLGGRPPLAEASAYVGSAGTAARFLTAWLGLSEGVYHMDASEQMRRRPMAPLLDSLRELGCEVVSDSLGEEDHFPFTLRAHGFQKNDISVNIDSSSQFLSALLMVSCLCEKDFTTRIEGKHGMSYIEMTVKMMEQFGVHIQRTGGSAFCTRAGQHYRPCVYQVEPDVSAACYFYAMSPLLNIPVLVRHVHFDSMQGDVQFVRILEEMGCSIKDTPGGILVSPPPEGIFHGVTADMSGCSDQAITLAAIAPFADSPTSITGIGHIRYQESDRIAAVCRELSKMGIRCEERQDGMTIYPGLPGPSVVETYDDHRMAMGFALTGLRSPGIAIANPGCCAKTFENYFEVFEKTLDSVRG